MFQEETSLCQWGEANTVTSSDSQLMDDSSMTWVCSAGKQGVDWSPWASPVNEGSCCSLRKAIFSFALPDTRAPVQMQHPSHAAGHGLISRAGSPHAELPWREETNYLLSASSLSFTWETLFYFPHLHIHRKHLSSSHFLIWVMNFYFLAFQRLLFLLLAGCPSTLHISRQFFFHLPERGKKISLYCLSWLLDLHSPALLIPSFQIPENVFRLVLHLEDSVVSSLCSWAGREGCGQPGWNQSCFCPPRSSCRVCTGGNPICIANVVECSEGKPGHTEIFVNLAVSRNAHSLHSALQTHHGISDNGFSGMKIRKKMVTEENQIAWTCLKERHLNQYLLLTWQQFWASQHLCLVPARHRDRTWISPGVCGTTCLGPREMQQFEPSEGILKGYHWSKDKPMRGETYFISSYIIYTIDVKYMS